MTIISMIRETVTALTQPFSEPLDLPMDFDSPVSANETHGTRARDPQFCRVMTSRQPPSDETLARAWRKLEETMALVPRGELQMSPMISVSPPGAVPDPDYSVNVEPFYIDRFAVTNRQFQQFVEDDGYNREELWSTEMLPYLLQFVDQTGVPGPKFWKSGKPPANQGEHPVVGISWYEAMAFATWSGRKLPSTAQWQHAGCWFSTVAGPHGAIYPWGNVFNQHNANTWRQGPGETVPVDDFRQGATPNGVYQLVGNVWEWTGSLLDATAEQSGIRLVFEHVMAEIRGGAFDTYFETQASCRFRTAQRLLYRGPNVGFRCCVRVEDLPAQPDPSAFLLEASS